MRKILIAAGVLPLLACSAQEFEALTAQTSAITELSHTVSTRQFGSTAVLTVRRLLRNDGPTTDELTETLDIPEGGVVTSLRAGREAALLDATEAEARWAELISPGDADPTTSAILAWHDFDDLQLRIFGFAAGATLTLEYTVQLPLRSAGDAWAFDYPIGESENGLLAVPTFDGSAIEPHEGYVRVSLPRAPIDRTDVKWALHRLSAERTIWRLELDTAAVLEPAAVRPNVVFVVDASHSQGSAGIAAQLELLAPYLANAPDAQVEVVLYRRFAERLFNRFVPAAAVARELAMVPPARLEPGNGSNLDLGAALAAQALSQVSGTGRILLFTDEQLRDGFSNSATVAALQNAPRDTVVHLVSRNGDSGGEELEESREAGILEPIATASGGILLRVSGHPKDPVQAASKLLGLVRPIRIDDFAIEAHGLDALDVPATLDEGTEIRLTAIAATPPPEITLTGKIWGRDYRAVVATDADLSRAMPALAIGLSNIETQLMIDELRDVALRAHAVSRVTSLLSAEPLAGASTLGTERLGLGGYGNSRCGCGGFSSHSSGCSGLRIGQPRPDYSEVLRGLFGARCGSAPATVTLEATADEIVAVEIAAEPAQARCLEEVVWATRLTDVFTEHRTYVVDL